jgi:hypothetical protein
MEPDVSLRRTTVALLAAAGALALPVVAAAAPAPSAGRALARDSLLWATVNVCDTTGYPDGIGIRGSMPGGGDRRQTMFMRLEVQFFHPSDRRWVRVGKAGDSGFLELGHGAARARQAGRTFTVMPPPAGRPAYLMRGRVTYEWRRDGAVARRAQRLTTAGHLGTPGADPADFTAATCSIT